MNINRHNYEEFFLLYVDNELTAEQKKSVEQYIQENPDLAGELELFRQTSLESDDKIVFEGKELLMKKENGATISLHNYEEWLVAYLDNELNPAERKEFEKFAALHPVVTDALSVFKQTKFHPEEEIIFVNKEILYRKEEKVRVVTMSWWKIAVAAAVVLAIGLSTFTVLTRDTVVPPVVAKTENKQPDSNKKEPVKTDTDIKNEPGNIPVAIDNDRDAVASAKTATSPEKIKSIQKGNTEKNSVKPVIIPSTAVTQDAIAKNTAPVNKMDVVSSSKEIENKIIANTVIDKKENDPLHTAVAANNTPVTENINSSPVTNNSGKPSDDKETANDKTTDTDAVFASNNEEGKNKKLRGFFRKATRVFEKRTNISAADDDDKVLIGVLAVRLK